MYVLTARHVCAPASATRAVLLGMIPLVEIQDVNGEFHNANVSLVSETDDLCIVKYESDTPHLVNVADVSASEPLLDSPAYSYAAPSGFYVPSAITMFEGIFSGNAILHGGQSSGVYTIPATGGSSGGAIINQDGEIVGVIHSTLVDFHHISLASTYNATVDFIEQLESQENIVILD